MNTGRQTLLPAGGRATFRSKALVLLGTMVILSSMFALVASRPGAALGAGATSLESFTVAAPTSVTAGTPFTVTVTAFDRRGRVVTDYPGPSTAQLTGLTASPNESPPLHGTLLWSSGIGTASVTATRSQVGATVTYTDAGKTASTSFSVSPSTATAIGFITQPVDTKFGEKIYSSLSSAAAVKVRATDAFGNPVSGINVTINASSGVLGGDDPVPTAGGTLGVSPYGEASFLDLTLPDLGTYTLGATAPVGAATLTANPRSSSFEIVAALSSCTGASCKNTGDNGADPQDHVPQKTYGTITPGVGSFSNNVVLTTQFADKAASQCTVGNGEDDLLVFGQTTEVRVQNTVSGGNGVASTQPDFRVTLLYPYETLQALDITSRGVPSFEVCLGATWLGEVGADETNAWQAKNLTSGILEPAVEAGDSNVYWGWVPDCASLTVEQKVTNPCFELRTKSASQLQSTLGLNKRQFAALELDYKSGDLALVVWKPFPWDGKFTAR